MTKLILTVGLLISLSSLCNADDLDKCAAQQCYSQEALELANLVSHCPAEMTKAFSDGSNLLGAFLIKNEKVKANVNRQTYQLNFWKDDVTQSLGIRLTTKLEINVVEKLPMLTDFPSTKTYACQLINMN